MANSSIPFPESNPRPYSGVRARLVQRAEEWPWSSVTAHLSGKDDALVKVAPALDRYGDFAAFLGQSEDEPAAFNALRRSETTGRPLGDEAWVDQLERQTNRAVKPQKRGPKPHDN